MKFAKRGRVHTVIATSPLHMRVKLNMTPEQVIETSIANVSRARNHIDDVEWSAEDGTRSEMDFLCRIVEAVIKAGATTVNIPDTVGLHGAGGIHPLHAHADRAGAEFRQGDLLGALP